jgi:uncharacterized coiled-coil protein SlyX
VELPNFTPDTWSHAHKQLAVLWLRFLKEIDGYRNNLPKEFTSNKLIRNAIKMCEEAALTPEELYAYERAKEQAQWDDTIKGLEDEVVASRKSLAEKDSTIAEKDNTIAEKDNTIAEKDNTIAEQANALQKAHAEKLETSKKMLSDGMSIETVCKYTGLTPQQISEIT